MASSAILFYVSCALLLPGGFGADSSARGEGFARKGEYPQGMGEGSLPALGAAGEGASTGPVQGRRELATHLRAASTPSPVKGAVHPEDAAALLKAAARWQKSRATLDKRKLLASWLVDNPCSQWYGVTCDRATGRVTALRLPGLGGRWPFFLLSGPLPAELGSLPELKSLILARNPLSNEVPKSWAGLGKISHLDLSGFSAFGYLDLIRLPQAVGKFTRLTYLKLSDSSFKAHPLPDDFSRLSRLAFLALAGDTRTPAGSTLVRADFQTLGRLTRLKSLVLEQWSNPFNGSISWSNADTMGLSQLKGLEKLRLRAYGVPGFSSFPLFLKALTRLVDLDFGSVQSSYTMPSWLGSLKQLTSLDASRSGLTGGIPAALGSLEGLVKLDLSYNQLFGSIPGYLFRPGRVLKLQLNQLSGPLPASALDQMAQLVAAAANGSAVKGSVDVSNNFLTGPCYSSKVSSLTCPAKTKSQCSKRVTQQLAGLRGNCLQQCEKAPVGSFPIQDGYIEEVKGIGCSVFCGADKPSGPCNGHGVCSFSGSEFVCDCDKGFVAPRSDKASCMPASKQK